MKNLLIGMLLAGFALTGYSQEDSIAVSPWSIGTITNYDVITHRYDRLPETNSYYSYDRGFNFTAGLRVQFRLNSDLAFRLGFAYSRKDFNEQYLCLECTNNTITYPTESKVRYLDIPLTASYLLKPGKLSLYAEGGLRGSFLLQAWETYNYGDLRPPQTFIVTAEYKSFLLSGTAGLHANLKASEHFSIDVGPTFTKPLHSPHSNNLLNWWEFNIQTGINFHF